MAAPKRRSQLVTVEDLDFENLFAKQPQSYLSQQEASRQKRNSAKLREIDHVIGDMRNEFNNLSSGEYTHPCPKCNKPLGKNDEMIFAVGKRFHPACFGCHHCGAHLDEKPYIEHAGHVYCLEDHAALFGAKCALCKEIITGKIVYALGTTWHMNHLKCAHCNQPLEPGFLEKDDKAYCPAHYSELFSSSCGRCNQRIEGNFFDSLGQKWHPQCYNCQVCHKDFSSGKTYPFNGQPHCELHFHEKNGTLCSTCRQPINGPCVRAIERPYHPACFKCTQCSKKIETEYFTIDGKPYCELHGSS